MQPGSENAEFFAFTQKVFSGDIRNRWIDRYNEQLFPKYRLIKEIRANLALKWLHDHFPQVPIIFLMRHPCAVVLSRLELGWATDKDIENFLVQPDLATDFLRETMDFIRKAKTDEEKHAIIWSVTNLIPLKQFKPGELKMVYYEDLCVQPEIELSAIFASIGQKYQSVGTEKINQPSQTARGSSAVVSGTNKVTNWKKRLSQSQVEKILRVVKEFDLDFLYGDSFMPLNCESENNEIL
jgi:hypothetical protein